MSEEYDKGHVAGGIDARLAGHDEHFARINGSLADVANELREVKLALQRLGDAANSDRHTVITTAKALKDAKDAEHAASTTSWAYGDSCAGWHLLRILRLA